MHPEPEGCVCGYGGQAGRMAGAMRDVNGALQSGRAGRLMTAEEMRQHDAIHAIIDKALHKAEGE